MQPIVEDDNIRPPPHYRPNGPPQVVTADTARQGPKGNRVLIILVASMIAAGLAWAILAMAPHL
ncbi:hypothetical protein [Methylocapsa sp. S129]|uniref:hypothetical protein n=1 Tax=Methylocapsa sp. S129 TaxID=1641869 RepID=UPI00131D9CCA|nr:hypothetical protein [Methylocapsa sp. S129]